jgi:rhamnosyl/mannosyltransferase
VFKPTSFAGADQPSGLRVCHLGKFYPPASGGIETHVQTLARAQAALGASVRVLCVNHATSAGEDVTWKRFTATPTVEEVDGPVCVTRVGRRASFARLDLCPRLLSELRALRRDPPDILHLHTPNPTMVLALALLSPAVPLVITHHSDIIKQRFLRRVFGPFERLVYGRAAHVLSDSPTYSAGSELLRRYEDKVSDLPLGLDLTPYLKPSAAARSETYRLRVGREGPLWLCVGRLVYYKGFHVALEALVRVPGTLHVIGTGPLKNELQRRAEELGVAERVVWRGHVSPDELIGTYHATTALWFPSNARSEGFGLAQVEAMASGCPVINTAIPASGVSWVSLHEKTGLTVPVNDATALACAAQRLLDEPGLRDGLGRNARERARQEFDHMIMAHKSLALYHDTLAETSPSPIPSVADASLV